jgi:hypothetical protein
LSQVGVQGLLMWSKVRRVRGRTGLLERLAALEPVPKADKPNDPIGSVRTCFGVGFAAGCTIGLGAAVLTPDSFGDLSLSQLSASHARPMRAQFSAAREIPSPSEQLSIERRLWWKMPMRVSQVQRDVIMNDLEPDAQARFAIAARHD